MPAPMYVALLAEIFETNFVQERWLRENDSQLLASCTLNFNLFFVATKHKDNVGHQADGLGIFVNKNFKVVKNISYSLNAKISPNLVEFGLISCYCLLCIFHTILVLQLLKLNLIYVMNLLATTMK